MTHLETLKKNHFQQDFWTSLCPGLHIGGLSSYDSNLQVQPTEMELQKECQKLDIDGYFKFEKVLNIESVRSLKQAISQIVNAGFPAIFVSVFDEFWQTVANLQPRGKRLLGEDYMIFPDYWVWSVDSQASQSGWKPHREDIVESEDRDYPVQSISLWVSLSNVSTENSCICLLPKSKDAGYPRDLIFNLETLQHVRALPVPEGSVIGWNQSIFHWGTGGSVWEDEPRISFAMEIRPLSIQRKIPCMISSNQVLSFSQRLYLIALQFEHYKHLHSESEEMMNFSQTFLKEHSNVAF